MPTSTLSVIDEFLRSSDSQLRRNALTALAALASAEMLLGGTETQRREAIYRKLLELNRAMVQVGPVNLGIRLAMRNEAQAILAILGCPAAVGCYTGAILWRCTRRRGTNHRRTDVWDINCRKIRIVLIFGVILQSWRSPRFQDSIGFGDERVSVLRVG